MVSKLVNIKILSPSIELPQNVYKVEFSLTVEELKDKILSSFDSPDDLMVRK